MLAFSIPINARTRKRHLVFKNSNYLISDWIGDWFPNVLYISCQGINGYMTIKPDVNPTPTPQPKSQSN